MQLAKEFYTPKEQREFDVTYRGRINPYHMGDSAMEKALISDKFEAYITQNNLTLKLDVSSNNRARLYGDEWYKFLAKSKAVLGIESGYSIVDIDDKLFEAYEKLLSINPNLTYELYKRVCSNLFIEYSKDFYYRTISPRHFEAAIFGCVQILYEGKYSNILKPNIHYIELKKDFSNIKEVIAKLEDKNYTNTITQNAYEELVKSGKYSYKHFIAKMESSLKTFGINQNKQIKKAKFQIITNNKELIEKNYKQNSLLNDKNIETLIKKIKDKKFVAISDDLPIQKLMLKLATLKSSKYILCATLASYVKLAPLGVKIDLLLIKNYNFAPIYYLANLHDLLEINPPKNLIYTEDANFEAVLAFSKNKKTKRYMIKANETTQNLQNPQLLVHLLESFSTKKPILLGYL